MRTSHSLSGLFISALVAASACLGAIYTDISQIPSLEYDYVIVGGGTAGNVVANRLTENPKVTVLVLEAGGTNDALALAIPLLCPTLSPSTPYDWNYTTIPQAALNDRVFPYPRGFVLGGSSSINFMFYHRGSRDDWNTYAKIADDPRWSWEAMYKHWSRKNEKFVPPADNHNITGQYKSAAHSTSGVVSVSLAGYSVPLDSRVIATTREFPNEFPFQIDVNAGNPLGIGWLQSTIGNGARSSSATAYLAPQYISRPNLSVLLHARATKVLKTGLLKGLPYFGAVEFAANEFTPITRVSARKEVILSAGTFNTPQLLMLSGIGNKTALDALGIESVIDLPGVGQNSSDHALLSNPFSVNSKDTFNMHTTPAVLDSEIARWNQTRQGPLTVGPGNTVGFFRLPKSDPVLQKYGDPSAGPTSAHYELVFANGFIGGVPPEGATNSIYVAVISPTSRGSVTLKSSNPFDSLLINPNFLGSELDMHVMLSGVKALRKIVTSNTWEGYFKGYIGDSAAATTDDQIIAYARNYTRGIWHAVGTAAMTKHGASYGVVDPDFRVKGAAGLRVVDASVLPFVPTAHTQGPTYQIAELASDVIRSQSK